MPIAYDPSRSALFQPGSAQTVFRRKAPGTLAEFAVEAARLAYIRAEQSSAEYARLAESIALADFDAPAVFHDTRSGASGFGARRADGVAVLAFRGTQPDRVGDLVNDARFALRAWDLGAGRVHTGFRTCAIGLWPQVQAWLAQQASARSGLLICGHSLGGAIATLLAAPSCATELVTIGSPRVGDADFVDALAQAPGLSQWRFVNCCDLVVEVPPEFLGFVHAAPMFYIDRTGNRAPESTAESIAADQHQARADYLAQHAFRSGSVLTRELADHAPANYIRAFYT